MSAKDSFRRWNWNLKPFSPVHGIIARELELFAFSAGLSTVHGNSTYSTQ